MRKDGELAARTAVARSDGFAASPRPLWRIASDQISGRNLASRRGCGGLFSVSRRIQAFCKRLRRILRPRMVGAEQLGVRGSRDLSVSPRFLDTAGGEQQGRKVPP